jgi:hypothetical protein
VSQHEQVGQRTLVATDGTHTAAADTLVITGPMQPSGHSRNPRVVVHN